MRNLLFALIVMVSCWGCSKEAGNVDPIPDPPLPPTPEDKEVVLQDQKGWETDTLSVGCIHYSFTGYDAITIAGQNVNVIEVDLSDPAYKLMFKGISRDSLSNIVSTVTDAIAATNGTYGEAVDGFRVSYFKSSGTVYFRPNLPASHLRFWKHEGAFYYDSAAKVAGIGYGNDLIYTSWAYPNIISGSPVLIDDYDAVGEVFVDPTVNLNGLPGEDKNKHQGVRHPRTAIALTESNKALLITVDGRRTQTAGMTAKELTQFIKKYFNPKYALNLDGGGSTTMWIKGSNLSKTDVINYPTDNGKYDHYGQRLLNTSIIITSTKK